MDTTSAQKSIIENRQRAMRKQEKEEGREWERRFFTRVDKAPAALETLAAKLGEPLNEGQTNGIWVFDQKKAAEAKSPYHPDVTPPIYEEVVADTAETS